MKAKVGTTVGSIVDSMSKKFIHKFHLMLVAVCSSFLYLTPLRTRVILWKWPEI